MVGDKQVINARTGGRDANVWDCPTCHGTGNRPISETTGNTGETGDSSEPTNTDAALDKLLMMDAVHAAYCVDTRHSKLCEDIQPIKAAIQAYAAARVAEARRDELLTIRLTHYWLAHNLNLTSLQEYVDQRLAQLAPPNYKEK